MKNTVQLVQQAHIHRCLIVHNALSTVQKYTAGELVVFFSYELSLMQQQHTGYVFHRTLVYYVNYARVVRELCETVNDQPALRHVADRITTALGE